MQTIYLLDSIPPNLCSIWHYWSKLFFPPLGLYNITIACFPPIFLVTLILAWILLSSHFTSLCPVMAPTTNVSKTFKGDGYQIAILSTMWAASRTPHTQFTAYTQHHLDICKDISMYKKELLTTILPQTVFYKYYYYSVNITRNQSVLLDFPFLHNQLNRNSKSNGWWYIPWFCHLVVSRKETPALCL